MKESRGASVYEVMKKFAIKRTAALYRIHKLSSMGLVTEYVVGKKKMYMAVEGEAMKGFFRQKIGELESELAILSKSNSKISHKSRSQRLTVSFVNYCDLLPEYRKRIEKYYDVIDYSNTQLYLSPKEFITRCKDADVIVDNRAGDLGEDILKELPRLQYIHLSTHMYGYVDLQACKDHGVSLSHLPFIYKSIGTTEFILAQTFALLRGTMQASEQVKSGVNEFRYFKGEQLRGKKAIIFGVTPGSKELCELLRGLGVEVAIYSESKVESPAFYGLSHFASIKEVFETGDIFYVPWTGDEKVELIGNIDSNFLNRIKRPVYIISVFKHPHIDFTRIRELIYEGLIKGITLDYFSNIASGDSRESEASKIMYLPSVVITPDIAWYTRDSVINMNTYTTECLEAYAQGKDDYLLI
ncbi:MAG: NAD(P)-dependent oxidoreductase [Candidatus Roizmanbacteria bacterium]